MNKKSKLVYGVGVNDADYQVSTKINYKNHKGESRTKVEVCPYYKRWQDMLKRCYSNKYLTVRSTFEGSTVCEEWLTFSNFKAWMEKQDWEDKVLNRDLLFKFGKEYNPEVCIFIHPLVSQFIKTTGVGECVQGVKISGNKFSANINNPFTKKKEYLGVFCTEQDAYLAWKKRKHELACNLAVSGYVGDVKVVVALRGRYL